MTRRRFARAGLITAIAALAYWIATTLFVQVTYFGDTVTVRVCQGYVAVYWSESAEDTNTAVLSGFCWPGFPASGVGEEWSEDEWGRWLVEGPNFLLSRTWLSFLWEYPQRAGFFLPGAGTYRDIRYIGLPAWCVGLCGLATWFATRQWLGRVNGRCRRCGYSLAGLATDAVCPECGRAPAPSRA